MIIGITGKMQNGKDTLAEMIKNKTQDYQIIHFADPLKEICKEYLGLTEYDVNTSEGKSKYNEFWEMTNRQILQKVGTDAMRNGFRQDVWCKIMSLRLNKNTKCLIPDVRFNDEAKLILDKGGIIIKINRDSANNFDDHISEKGIHEDLITVIIQNDGTLDQLEEKVQILIDKLELTGN